MSYDMARETKMQWKTVKKRLSGNISLLARKIENINSLVMRNEIDLTADPAHSALVDDINALNHDLNALASASGASLHIATSFDEGIRPINRTTVADRIIAANGIDAELSMKSINSSNLDGELSLMERMDSAVVQMIEDISLIETKLHQRGASAGKSTSANMRRNSEKSVARSRRKAMKRLGKA